MGADSMTLLTDIDDVKKRLAKLEDETRFKLRQMEESFALFRDVVIQMQKEKTELEKRNILLERENKMLIEKQKMPIIRPLQTIPGKINEKLVRPVRNDFEDTVNLVKEALKEEMKEDANEEKDLSYIEISEPLKKKEQNEVDSKDDGTSKRKVAKWLREKYGIDQPEKQKINKVDKLDKKDAKKKKKLLAG
jgi:predicted  nucleic acid-binding Zn-ribbon protein